MSYIAQRIYELNASHGEVILNISHVCFGVQAGNECRFERSFCYSEHFVPHYLLPFDVRLEHVGVLCKTSLIHYRSDLFSTE